MNNSILSLLMLTASILSVYAIPAPLNPIAAVEPVNIDTPNNVKYEMKEGKGYGRDQLLPDIAKNLLIYKFMNNNKRRRRDTDDSKMTQGEPDYIPPHISDQWYEYFDNNWREITYENEEYDSKMVDEESVFKDYSIEDLLWKRDHVNDPMYRKALHVLRDHADALLTNNFSPEYYKLIASSQFSDALNRILDVIRELNLKSTYG
ncbi:hypothetical protein ElyMa_002268400 [Elysia marginata]|uniref:Uncharacterized protein n=1 Tax=Elysia marginata TaxID=1093978 RepID=A0AAV4G0P0_9GAST|nr:hypothetical protein ElyMa_002268400 [Elysia marginata]